MYRLPWRLWSRGRSTFNACSSTSCTVGPVWALPSCHAEPARGGGCGEPLHHIGQRRLEGFPIQPGTCDSFPGDPVLPGLEFVQTLGGELGLDSVFDGLHLLFGFLNESLQGAQFPDFAFHLVHTHDVIPFRLMWGEHRRRGALWGNPRRGHSISRSALIGHLFSAFAYSLEPLPVLFPPDIMNYTTDNSRYQLASYIKISVDYCAVYLLITIDK